VDREPKRRRLTVRARHLHRAGTAHRAGLLERRPLRVSNFGQAGRASGCRPCAGGPPPTESQSPTTICPRMSQTSQTGRQQKGPRARVRSRCGRHLPQPQEVRAARVLAKDRSSSSAMSKRPSAPFAHRSISDCSSREAPASMKRAFAHLVSRRCPNVRGILKNGVPELHGSLSDHRSS